MYSGPALPLIVCISLALLSGCARAPTAVPTANPAVTQSLASQAGEMVLVPAGAFVVGATDADPKATADEKPAHAVYLDAFWIDRTEVTNARFIQFLNALGDHRGVCMGRDCAETRVEDKCSRFFGQNGRYVVEDGFDDHPATQVSWYGAQAYCEWTGARLPAEAEWEKAARGGDGRVYAWGDEPPGCDRAQYGDCSGWTLPAGSRLAGASPFRALDMAGNVWEWVADRYDQETYGSSPLRNPLEPDTGIRGAFRGGSWGYPPSFLRATGRARNRPTYAGFNVGFRCAADGYHK